MINTNRGFFVRSVQALQPQFGVHVFEYMG